MTIDLEEQSRAECLSLFLENRDIFNSVHEERI
jgi:hypothetical protein